MVHTLNPRARRVEYKAPCLVPCGRACQGAESGTVRASGIIQAGENSCPFVSIRGFSTTQARVLADAPTAPRSRACQGVDCAPAVTPDPHVLADVATAANQNPAPRITAGRGRGGGWLYRLRRETALLQSLWPVLPPMARASIM